MLGPSLVPPTPPPVWSANPITHGLRGTFLALGHPLASWVYNAPGPGNRQARRKVRRIDPIPVFFLVAFLGGLLAVSEDDYLLRLLGASLFFFPFMVGAWWAWRR
jgi:hypothetical protein